MYILKTFCSVAQNTTNRLKWWRWWTFQPTGISLRQRQRFHLCKVKVRDDFVALKLIQLAAISRLSGRTKPPSVIAEKFANSAAQRVCWGSNKNNNNNNNNTDLEQLSRTIREQRSGRWISNSLVTVCVIGSRNRNRRRYRQSVSR